MNLFKTIADTVGVNDDVTIVVRKNADGLLVASVRVENRSVKDGARNLIAPFVVKGTPEELDEGFVDALTAPLAQSAGLQTSMQHFEAAKKAAEAQSQAAKAEADKAKKMKETAKKEVDGPLKAADELKDAKKFGEAKKAYDKAKAKAEAAGLKEEAAKAKAGAELCSRNDVPDIFSAFGPKAEQEAPSDHQPADNE